MNIFRYVSFPYRWILSFVSLMSNRTKLQISYNDDFITVDNDFVTVNNNFITVDNNFVTTDDDFVLVDDNKTTDLPIIVDEYIDDALLKYNYSEFIIRRPKIYKPRSIYSSHNYDLVDNTTVDIYIYQTSEHIHMVHNQNTYTYNKIFDYISGPDQDILHHFRIKPYFE
jgi:hypothetical protein